MKRWLFFLYGVGCHLLFLGTFAYLVAFIGNIWVPKSIDSNGSEVTAGAIAINLLLLGLFAAQHSIMARPAFKRIWTRIVPQPIERATYVLLSCLVLIVVMWQWRGISTVVWDVEQPVFRAMLWGLFVTGCLLVPLVSLLISHFDLFGTRQVWLHLQGRDYTALPFRTPLFYKYVRHPLYIGWAISFWAIPTMTVGHLLFAAVLTAYMGLAALVEERDLVEYFGREYEHYQRRVPMFVPRLAAIAAIAQPENPLSTAVDAADAEASHG